MADLNFDGRSAFEGILHSHGSNAGEVKVEDRSGLGLASVLTRKGRSADLQAAVRSLHGFDLPDGPRLAGIPALRFAGVGPDRFLAIGEIGSLAGQLGAYAAVVDQSDGYGVLRLSGMRVRETLAKGVSIDLHPTTFPVGSVATTSIAHIGVNLWRLDDADGAPVFEIALFRSLAESFWHFLSLSAAEWGLAVVPSR